MSVRTCRRVLWTAFVLTIPLPFLLVEIGRVPAARVLMLGGITLAVIAVEGSQGAVGTAAALLLAQGLVHLALLWLAAYAASRVFVLGSPRSTALLTAAAVVALVLFASAFEIYRTPFSARSLRANLLHVYE
jgi:hypothetical protein